MSDPDSDAHRRELRWDGLTLSSVVVINHKDYEMLFAYYPRKDAILREEEDAEAE